MQSFWLSVMHIVCAKTDNLNQHLTLFLNTNILKCLVAGRKGIHYSKDYLKCLVE
jgi:hypothetical protein